MLQEFVHLHIVIRPHIFLTYNDTRSIVERTSHSHILRYFCHRHDAHERIYLSIFFCQDYYNSCSFLLFHFLLFCIVSHLYLIFLRSRKTNTKCCHKNEKNSQRHHLGVASKICSYSLGHNILELYNTLVQIRFSTSKTKLDI